MKLKCSIKGGISAARLHGLRPEMAVALIIIKDAFFNHGENCVITSGVEGKHSRASLHYIGAALDFRTGGMKRELVSDIANEIRSGLGVDFDAVVEDNHLHIEYQPKRDFSDG